MADTQHLKTYLSGFEPIRPPSRTWIRRGRRPCRQDRAG